MRYADSGKNLFNWTPGFGVLNPPAEELVKTGFGGADIYKKDRELNFDIVLPGLNKEDINVRVENNYLVVKGELKKSEQVEQENYLMVERQSGLFQRNYPIPEEVDMGSLNHITATYDKGILNVKLPLKNEPNSHGDSHEIDIE
ncbi:Hsp20/alpha crystallin family protein [Natranaerobius thermophilus]|uniref:Hsp20/alpha crystallin family protein n=1 Tax=Natranaerobius thermophilus TaxID=375929 RepID=UPI00068F436F|nr:Hsp20/alpha crystallin family protein [Natranaerobius thermophilus]